MLEDSVRTTLNEMLLVLFDPLKIFLCAMPCECSLWDFYYKKAELDGFWLIVFHFLHKKSCY